LYHDARIHERQVNERSLDKSV